MKNPKTKFIIFCIGLSTAIASSLILLLILCLNLAKVEVVAFETNPFIAGIEIILLTVGIATCFVASEIYYEYLKLKG